MDCTKIGALIYKLRCEKNMTQKDIADKLNISDKTVSKWERGLGCPDVNLLSELSDVLGVNIEKLLNGSLETNTIDNGNFKNIKFYVCPVCKNIISSTSLGDFSCCGRKLEPLKANEPDNSHKPIIESVENDLYITFNHEMTKSHYISFVSYVMTDRILTVKLYPEQEASVRIPKIYKGTLYFFCTEHSMMKVSIW